MTAYTDDDVTAAAFIIAEYEWQKVGAAAGTPGLPVGLGDRALARRVVAGVASVIAARALREAADDIETDRNDHWFSAFDAVSRLRARAEAVGQ